MQLADARRAATIQLKAVLVEVHPQAGQPVAGLFLFQRWVDRLGMQVDELLMFAQSKHRHLKIWR